MPNTKSINVKVNGVSFNASFYADWKEADFIKDQFGSLPSNIGSDANKNALLKEAFAQIKKATGK